MIFTIEANIGAGKSTVGQILSKEKDIVFVQEPVHIWQQFRDENGDILEHFYRDKSRYSFALQIMARDTRSSLMEDIIRKYPDHIIIFERCISTDRNVFAKMLHEDGYMSDLEWKIYDNLTEKYVQKIDKHIFIDVTPEICSWRIEKRSRKGEVIPISYLERCDLYHRKWLDSLDNVLTIRGDQASENIAREILDIVRSK